MARIRCSICTKTGASIRMDRAWLCPKCWEDRGRPCPLCKAAFDEKAIRACSIEYCPCKAMVEDRR